MKNKYLKTSAFHKKNKKHTKVHFVNVATNSYINMNLKCFVAL